MPNRWSRIVNLLFWVPLAAAIPIFEIVRRLVPDIGDGIGAQIWKLNVSLGVVCPVIGVCWLAAILIESVVATRRGSVWPIAIAISIVLYGSILFLC